MEDPLLAGAGNSRLTMRLRLEPASPVNAADLWLVHNDDKVSYWYGSEKPSLEEAERRATFMGQAWRLHGVHKWIAYDRVSGEVVGRGGLSRTPVDDDWGQIYAFLPAEPWVRVAHEIRRPFIAHANWLEIGWALRREFWGRGYASEIGRAGLAFAWSASACGTRARSAAAAWLKGLKENRTTRRSRCACCCEETGTGPLRLPWSYEEAPGAGRSIWSAARGTGSRLNSRRRAGCSPSLAEASS